MEIGAISFRPYVYNTNNISSSSLSKVSGIGEDLTSQKTDYSELTDESLNENPLHKGETANFMDILGMQMQMGRMNASRVMQPSEEIQGVEEAMALDSMQAGNSTSDAQETSGTEAAIMSASGNDNTAMDVLDAAEDFKAIDSAEQLGIASMDMNIFKMQQAAKAYQVNMIA